MGSSKYRSVGVITAVVLVTVWPAAKATSAQPVRLVADSSTREHTFGLQIAIHAGELLIGSPGDSFVNNRSGAVEVFVRDGGGWVRKQYVRPAASAQQFGQTFALAGDRLVVRSYPRWIHTFRKVDGFWARESVIEIPDSLGLIAARIFPVDSTIVVQMYRASNSPNVSAFYGLLVYSPVEAGWELQQLILPDAAGMFGAALCLSRDLLVVGDYRDPGIGNGKGVVYTFRRDAGQWQRVQKFAPHDLTDSDQFGRLIACFDDRLVINSSSRGKTYTFEREGDQFVEADTIVVPHSQFFTGLHGLGDTLAVAGYRQYGELEGRPLEQSPVYFYRRSGLSWVMIDSLISPVPLSPGERDDGAFGWAMVQGDGVFAVSAPYRDRFDPYLDEMGEVFVWPTEWPVGMAAMPRTWEAHIQPTVYPNPFGDSLTVGTTLSTPAHVTISMFDMLGRQLCKRDIGIQPAGRSATRLDGSGLSPGVYVVRVATGDHVQARSVVRLD